jgi:hypothetical protein
MAEGRMAEGKERWERRKAEGVLSSFHPSSAIPSTAKTAIHVRNDKQIPTGSSREYFGA